MKVLLHSNSPWSPTGYGQQTALFAPLLAEHYDLALSAFYGLEGSRINWQGIPVYPGLGGEFGNDYLVEHARRHFGGDPRGGLVLTLMDVWVLRPDVAKQLNVASWVPVDHEPAVPGVVRFFLESGSIPLTMSHFGEEQLAEFDPLYVPHGVDVDTFKPYDREEVRRSVGVPEDAFLVGMVAANKGRPSRKGFQQAFEAFRHFRGRYENAYLYLHTTVNPDISSGEDIPNLLASLQIPPESVLLADQYRMLFDPFSGPSMARIYSTLDVLLNPSMGEGFGIPVLEAQACGVPVIVTDFSAMKEVCGAGWRVGCRPYWTGLKSWQAMPDVEDIVGSLEHCYSLPPASKAQLAKKARNHALQYAASKVLEDQFIPALNTALERFEERAPVTLEERVAA